MRSNATCHRDTPSWPFQLNSICATLAPHPPLPLEFSRVAQMHQSCASLFPPWTSNAFDPMNTALAHRVLAYPLFNELRTTRYTNKYQTKVKQKIAAKGPM